MFTTYKDLAKTNYKFYMQYIKIFPAYSANQSNNFFDDSSATEMEDSITQIRMKFDIFEEMAIV